jgi:hypothetical protein
MNPPGLQLKIFFCDNSAAGCSGEGANEDSLAGGLDGVLNLTWRGVSAGWGMFQRTGTANPKCQRQVGFGKCRVNGGSIETAGGPFALPFAFVFEFFSHEH